ncbi:MAG: TetR/AcrR family transcriptional regulator [Alphaproteobacteria bacterium]|jgi:AcrR family transcriptional regulator|nr:TetR/AcrR family transcriptional regulator [Alphaproteobacteria bacterium]
MKRPAKSTGAKSRSEKSPDEKSLGGRPWSFDREKAVDTALRLFWRHGYEGVSVGDLTTAIGVAPPSLYAAFGSKAGLYREALDRYENTYGTLDIAALSTAPSLADAVRILLEEAVRTVMHPDRERGCMISSGLISCHPDHIALARDAAGRRDAMRDGIAEALRPFAGADEIRRLARHLVAVLQGISIQVRDGATPKEMQEIVDDVVVGIEARYGRARRKR